VSLPKSLEAQVTDTNEENARLRSLIEQLRPFAKHDPSCPWFGHDYGVMVMVTGRNYFGEASVMGPVTEPCWCGLGALDVKIDEAVP